MPASLSNKTFRLNNGVGMPAVGFGTFAASESTPDGSYRATKAALEAGYRHLDCAWFYKNEAEIGRAIRDFLAETPSVSRADLFVCTKVWNHLHAPEDVAWSLQNSLEALGLDYVDLFLVHWPIAAERDEHRQPRLGPDGKYIINSALTEDPTPTWRAMEQQQRSGKARAIGVSNWTVAGLRRLLDNVAEIRPAVNQLLLGWGVRRGYAVLPKSSTPARIASNLNVPALSDADYEDVWKVARGRKPTRFVNMKHTFGFDLWPEEAEASV
ncbi:hypothetical protein MAPG_00270 [Magnaporthiopsis poae ATCC 64411]|uniref:NADP-dependent oxidoreductase domain-containing protein n=1 Tax=Magnaporthiopsis poae (strain ATCC 64411 / 73-15) TaxID=644358 RepID=A0A0C4DKJ5_MAGP6|nr:hypothetical protein MAPG_00270 [Magnaporthiopsis poae ATCC 64411]